MSRALIGLVPSIDAENGRLFNRWNYLRAVEEAGGIPVILPVTAEPEVLSKLADSLDGFVFTGGVDIAPSCYGEEPLPELGEVQRERDALEAALLPLVMDRGKSILGICRGIQAINVFLGGSLWQDLPSQQPSVICHRQERDFDIPVHTVSVVAGTPLAALSGKGELRVNSMHHQAVRTLAPALRPMAYAPDGVLEAVWAVDYPYLRAYQWHPEYLTRSYSVAAAIFTDFVKSIV